MADKVTAPSLRAMRARGEKIVCVTAYDATYGAIADAAGVDVVLIGDSVGNTVLGYESTVPVTLEQMAHHTRATRAGVQRALLVADLPLGSYGATVEQAFASAMTLVKAGAEAVKLEGDYPEAIAAIVKAGVPVMAHLGFTPQSVHGFGGHRVQGKGKAGDAVVAQAHRVAEAGAFALVLELVPADLAERITREVDCPTIGIGAGAGCDGQIQVLHDVLGLSPRPFRHAKRYLEARTAMTEALSAYAEEVRTRSFPTEENSF